MNIHSIYSVAASSILCIQSELSEKSLPAFEIFPLIGNSQLLQQLSRPGVKAQIILSSIIVKTLISRSASILRPFHHPIWIACSINTFSSFLSCSSFCIALKATSAIYCLKGAFALRMWVTYKEHIFSHFTILGCYLFLLFTSYGALGQLKLWLLQPGKL